MADTGILEGMKVGSDIVGGAMDYATKKAQLGIEQQNANTQLGYLNDVQRQHNIETGKTYFNMMSDIAEEPGQKVRAAKIAGLKDFSERAGVNLDDSWVASLQDEAWKPKYSELFKTVRGTNTPEAQDAFFHDLTDHLGGKASMGVLDKAVSGISQVEAAKYKQQNQVENQKIRTVKQAFGEIDKKNQPWEFNLGASKKFDDILADYRSGKIVGTENLLNTLSTDYAKMVQGTGRFTEGSQERADVVGPLQKINTAIGKLQNAPKDADIGAIVKNIENEVNTMKSSTMQAIDANHEEVRQSFQDLPMALKSIDNKFAGIRSGQAKIQKGGWQGYNQEGVPSADEMKSFKKGETDRIAAQEANAVTPEMKTKAMQFKGSYLQMPEGKKKQDILNAAKKNSAFAAALKSVGIQ